MARKNAPNPKADQIKTLASDLHAEGLESSAASNPEGMTVTNVRPSLVRIAGLKFKPGDTKTIPPEFVDRVRRSTIFGRYLVEGIAAMPPPMGISRPTDLSGFDESKALAFIRQEADRKTLVEWARSEERAGVLQAIADRAKGLG